MSIIVDEDTVEKIEKQLSEGNIEKAINFFMSAYGKKIWSVLIVIMTFLSTKTISGGLDVFVSDLITIGMVIISVALLYLFNRSQKQNKENK